MPSSTAARVACKCVFNAGLLFLHFAFSGSTDVDLSHAASQLGDSFFQLFAVVIAGAVRQFASNLLDASLDVSLLAATFDNRGVVLVDDDLASRTQGQPVQCCPA